MKHNKKTSSKEKRSLKDKFMFVLTGKYPEKKETNVTEKRINEKEIKQNKSKNGENDRNDGNDKKTEKKSGFLDTVKSYIIPLTKKKKTKTDETDETDETEETNDNNIFTEKEIKNEEENNKGNIFTEKTPEEKFEEATKMNLQQAEKKVVQWYKNKEKKKVLAGMKLILQYFPNHKYKEKYEKLTHGQKKNDRENISVNTEEKNKKIEKPEINKNITEITKKIKEEEKREENKKIQKNIITTEKLITQSSLATQMQQNISSDSEKEEILEKETGKTLKIQQQQSEEYEKEKTEMQQKNIKIEDTNKIKEEIDNNKKEIDNKEEIEEKVEEISEVENQDIEEEENKNQEIDNQEIYDENENENEEKNEDEDSYDESDEDEDEDSENEKSENESDSAESEEESEGEPESHESFIRKMASKPWESVGITLENLEEQGLPQENEINDDERTFAGLSYFPFLSFFVLNTRKDSPFAMYHAWQGFAILAIFLASLPFYFLLKFIFGVSFIFWIFYMTLFGASAFAAYMAWSGKYVQLPIISSFAKTLSGK